MPTGQPSTSPSIARWAVLLAVALCVGAVPALAAVGGQTFTVTSAEDDREVSGTRGDGVCAVVSLGGACTLAAAIDESNALAGHDTIVFDIGGGGRHRIRTLIPLPVVSDPATIDGTTQPGYDPASPPLIEIYGGGTTAAYGFDVTGGGTTIRGFAITTFLRNPGAAVRLRGNGGNVLEANWLSFFNTGEYGGGGSFNPRGNRLSVAIENSPNNRIGSSSPGLGNRMMAIDSNFAVTVTGAATGNRIVGNIVGLGQNGGTPNSASHGISISTPGTIIGGSAPGEGNVISGLSTGVRMNTGGDGSLIQGNVIGLGTDGLAPRSNGEGIHIAGADDVRIGGSASGEGNTISGNTYGIRLSVPTTTGGSDRAVIQGNRIGTDVSGTVRVGNNRGMYLFGGLNPIIGGTTGVTPGGSCTGACNLITGNGFSGAELVGADGAVIQGNVVGLDVSGQLVPANGPGGIGISMTQTSNGLIGGTTPEERNVVTTLNAGIIAGGSGTVVSGNYVGTDATGEAVAVPFDSPASQIGIRVNGGDVLVGGTHGLTIGGACTGACNLVGGRAGSGIHVAGAGGAIVQGNHVGLDVHGNALGNGTGISTEGSLALIGGTTDAERNIVSGNTGNGFFMVGNRNHVTGNLVGIGRDGTTPLGNGGAGIYLQDGASHRIGYDRDTGTGLANEIAYNGTQGVAVGNAVDAGARISRNAIRDNGPATGNGGLGIDLFPHRSINANDNHDLDRHLSPSDGELQNHPILGSAVVNGDEVTVDGQLQSVPSSDFVIELFGNDACDPSGRGEGQAFLGEVSMSTDSNGNGSFVGTFTVPDGTPTTVITATAAKGEGGGTSEFSPCQLATLDLTPDIFVTKEADRHAAGLGDTVIFTVLVENVGTAPAPDVELTDPLPAGMTVVSAETSSGSCTTTATDVECALGTVGIDDVVQVTIEVEVTGPGPYDNTATATTSAEQGGQARDRHTATVLGEGGAAIDVIKEGPDTAVAGEELTYTITVRNDGPSDASGVQITDPLPDGLTLSSVQTDDATCSEPSENTVVCNVGTLAADDEVVVVIVATADEDTDHDVENSATVTFTDPEAGTIVSDPVTTTVRQPEVDLAVVKSGSPIVAGRVTFTIDVTNHGLDAARQVIARDTLQAGLELVSVETTQGTCNDESPIVCHLGALAAGETATVTIVADVLVPGPIENTATVEGEPDPDLDNNTSTANPGGDDGDPGLLVHKTSVGTFPEGGTGTYEIRVSNPNDVTVSGPVWVTDELPDGLEFVSATGGGFDCTVDGQRVTCTRSESFDAGHAETITMVVNVTAADGEVLVNTARVLWPGGTATGSDGTPVGTPDLTIAKATEPHGDPAVGSQLTYTIEVVNTGTAAAEDVIISDPLPPNVTYQSHTSDPDGICSVAASVVTCDAGRLEPQDAVHVVIVVTINASGEIANTASVSSRGGGEETSTATTTVEPPDHTITKEVSRSEATVGDQLTYTITALNLGPGPSYDLSIIDPLPPGIELLAVDTEDGATCDNPPLPAHNPPILTCTIEELTAGDAATVVLLVRTMRPGTLSNTAELDPEHGDPIVTDPVTTKVEPRTGRMTGGGSVFTAGGTRVTHGFTLHCDTADRPNNLQVNWDRNRFHLEQLDTAICTDDPDISHRRPPADFDTYEGSGTGRLNGISGHTIRWLFTDAGEPGSLDTAWIEVRNAADEVVVSANGNVSRGNHQAHRQ